MDPNTNPVPPPEQIPSPQQPEQLQPVPARPEIVQAAPEAVPMPSSVPPSTPVQPLPTIPPAAATADPTQTAPATSSANPAMADDVDVIEKEWVDRAERVIKATAGNPHAEEEAVEDLQIDYMKKRYGRDVKKSE